jgi:hypothetical protein
MSAELWPVLGTLGSGALAVFGVLLSGRLKTRGDLSVKLLDVLVSERDKAEAAAERAEARARRWEQYAWTLYRLLQKAGVDDLPEWPTSEQPKVTI